MPPPPDQQPVPPPPARRPAPSGDKTVMRSLGEFFGHVWKGVAADPNKTVVSKKVQERTAETPKGVVTLRRTTIDEVELHPGQKKAGERRT